MVYGWVLWVGGMWVGWCGWVLWVGGRWVGGMWVLWVGGMWVSVVGRVLWVGVVDRWYMGGCYDVWLCG